MPPDATMLNFARVEGIPYALLILIATFLATRFSQPQRRPAGGALDRPAASGTVLVQGTFSSSVDWALTAVTLRAAATSTETTEPRDTSARNVLVPTLRVLPNPAPGAARIAASLPPGVRARVLIHDVAGRRLRSLGDVAGDSTWLIWDGRDEAGNPVSVGLYFVHLEIGGRRLIQKVVLQRDG